MRLDKFLSDANVDTRSRVKRLISGGRVAINGAVARDAGLAVDPGRDAVTLDGQAVAYARFTYIMLNKPAGCVSATRDREQDTVLELLPPELARRGLFPVGRLDKDTVGLLLLTDDGALAHALLAPRRHVDKVYYAKVEGMLSERDARAFSEGVALGDGTKCLPARLRILCSGEISEAEVTLREGKYHQIKRMFLALSKRVICLKRLSIGPLRLDPRLPEGAFRPLEAKEVETLYNAAGTAFAPKT